MQPNSLSRHKDAVPREFAAAPIRRSVALFLVLVAAFTIGIPALLLFMGSIPGRGEVGNSPAHGLSETAIGTMNVFRETQGTFFSKLPEANQRWIRGVSQLESELDEGGIWNSQSRDALRTLLVRIGQRRVGDVEIGHAGTLFFLPDIRHLIGPGFLTEEFLQRRSQEIGDKGTRVQPDSRVAILDFQKQLLNLGIQLIVVPTPSKAAIISEQLSVQCAAGAWALRNSSLEQWKRELSAAGVLVFDPSEVLMEAKQNRAAVSPYLRTDTHWAPDAMQQVAERLAKFVQSELAMGQPEETRFIREPQTVSNAGDLSSMLQLSVADQRRKPERVVIQKVSPAQNQRSARGLGSEAEAAAPVLLLGDSFTNIYSAGEMQWGTSAGFAEQLSFELQLAVDSLAVNGGGATESRRTLIREIVAGRAALAGKKVVIWQFAARDLSCGDWPVLKVPPQGAVFSGEVRKPETVGNERDFLWISGRVRTVTALPKAAGLPYPDAVICIHLDSVTAESQVTAEGQRLPDSAEPDSEVIVYAWGLRNRRLVADRRFVAGAPVTLRVQPWERVRSQYERYYRVELEDPDFQLAELPIFWVESVAEP